MLTHFQRSRVLALLRHLVHTTQYPYLQQERGTGDRLHPLLIKSLARKRKNIYRQNKIPIIGASWMFTESKL